MPPATTLADLTVSADDLASAAPARIFRDHGCLVVRGLASAYVPALMADAAVSAADALALLPQAWRAPDVGWYTPDGALFLPAPAHFGREQQLQILGMGYRTSAALLESALDRRTVGLMVDLLGEDVELFNDGQVPWKEPNGSYVKHLHQDSTYFEHHGPGPIAVLIYGVSTTAENGALHVVPDSHRHGTIRHVDTDSHMGLTWGWERALEVPGEPGDAIIFHVHCVHGSGANHSGSPRPTFINRYRRVDDYVIAGGITAAQRAAAEAAAVRRSKDPSERGILVHGRRRFGAPATVSPPDPAQLIPDVAG